LTRINLRFVNTNSHFNSGTTIKLQGSNDNSIWTDLNAGASYDASTDNNIIAPYWTVNTPNEQFSVTQNQGRYRYYRLFATAGVVNSNGLPNEVYFTLSANYQASGNPKATCSSDTDSDGIPNHRDADSDGDGCNDAVESGIYPIGTTVPVAGSGNTNYGSNGFVNARETSNESGVLNGRYTYVYATTNSINACLDSDGDLVGDVLDLDDDNDGVLDAFESSSCSEIGRNLTQFTFNGNSIGAFTESSITTRNTGGWATSYTDQVLKLPISLTLKANSSVGIDNMFGLFPVSGTQTLNNWQDGGYKFYFTASSILGAFPSAWTINESRNVTDEYKI